MELYGLFEFPSRTDQPEPPSLHPNAQSVDIIAVHGLGGSWRTTWSAGKDDNPTIWLRDRLPEVLARVNVHPRIRAFGYDYSYVFSSSASDLESCAEQKGHVSIKSIMQQPLLRHTVPSLRLFPRKTGLGA
ncbi:hypothetical protein F4776DRAFT_589070 [Hypoxylon sp. NC0597]|nr:hypothetical protein F4776DRAFT_589070 [Hypoxylon sp. NC0597]